MLVTTAHVAAVANIDDGDGDELLSGGLGSNLGSGNDDAIVLKMSAGDRSCFFMPRRVP